VWGAHLRAATIAATWPHELAAVSQRVAEEIRRQCTEVRPHANVAAAFIDARLVRRSRAAVWIPFGGTSALGMLGHVNAALELARQIEAEELPRPSEVVVAHGTGGTAAGLALGFAIAGLRLPVTAVRAGPRYGAERGRLSWLAWRTSRLMRRLGADPGDAWRRISVALWHDAYAGAYGRPLAAAEEVASDVGGRLGTTLDATYSAKACYAALVRGRRAGPVLFWHTFDGRWLRRDAPDRTR
jgi:D-cysteine desulfhydrase